MALSDKIIAAVALAVLITVLASCRGDNEPVSIAEDEDTITAVQTSGPDTVTTCMEKVTSEIPVNDANEPPVTDETGTATAENTVDGMQADVTQTTAETSETVETAETETSTDIIIDEVTSSDGKETEEHPDDDNVDWGAWQT
jgi:hypothetical protein